MGTQQILLIVLSVIIVGVAIAVGISMFGNQAYNSNQSALSGELQHYAAQVVSYYKTPIAQGGCGLNANNLSPTGVSTYLGFDPTAHTLTTDNGTYKVTLAQPSDTTVVVTGLGKELKNGNHPLIITRIHLGTGLIASDVSAGLQN